MVSRPCLENRETRGTPSVNAVDRNLTHYVIARGDTGHPSKITFVSPPNSMQHFLAVSVESTDCFIVFFGRLFSPANRMAGITIGRVFDSHTGKSRAPFQLVVCGLCPANATAGNVTATSRSAYWNCEVNEPAFGTYRSGTVK